MEMRLKVKMEENNENEVEKQSIASGEFQPPDERSMIPVLIIFVCIKNQVHMYLLLYVRMNIIPGTRCLE